MKHSQSPKTIEKLNTLLRQYKEYSKAPTEAEKDRIGDSMTYADPVVWMMYKHKAYFGSDHEIETVGALREHCDDHGGICSKRFDFLARTLKNSYGKNILDKKQFADDMSIEDFYGSDMLNDIVSNGDFMRTWESHEFYKKNDEVAKWQNYKI